MTEEKVFEFQLKMLDKGTEEIQRIIARYDELTFKVKTITLTMWVAVIGWSFTITNQKLSLVAIAVLIGFWSLSATYRAIQIRYIKKSEIINELFNNKNLLLNIFNNQEFPKGLVHKIDEKEEPMEKLYLFFRGYISPAVIVFYIFLIIVNLFIWRFAY